MSGMFHSLRSYNYRLWAGGALVSNVGTWMQRIGQDWLVLTVLTHHNATAVGTVMALQFGPPLLLLPLSGFAADHMDRRKLLLWTQGASGLLALGLGLLTIFGAIQLWQVYGFALLLGIVTAFDAPARQAFVSDLVSDDVLANAVALNSASFNAARMVGPAAAGVLIAAVGEGWLFLINAGSYAAVLVSLWFLRRHELLTEARPKRTRGSLLAGFHYVWKRPDLMAVLVMLLLLGTFGFNFAIFISTMSVTVFHGNASQYGLLTSAMAAGTMCGALLSARRAFPGMVLMGVAAAAFGVSVAVAAVMPSPILFAIVLFFVGLAALTFMTASNSMMQLTTERSMRGRVLALRIAVVMGGTPIGAPLVGWVVDRFGARWALGVGAVAGIAAAGVAVAYLVRHCHLRLFREAGRLRLTIHPEPADVTAVRVAAGERVT
ncbi:Predicted arabinose efflux permease, MFS family [Rhodanobacter glycinis]|uniref:Predicted arabinose efflux permease, MFS family n=2 Tax=Rhodanobacter glycinis TaxID=582702 RepID=A0A1I4C001_9GAMM|nr:Predicted arabinose efflux permease, MFS family [Rhodanobacter glycinis]